MAGDALAQPLVYSGCAPRIVDGTVVDEHTTHTSSALTLLVRRHFEHRLYRREFHRRSSSREMASSVPRNVMNADSVGSCPAEPRVGQAAGRHPCAVGRGRLGGSLRGSRRVRPAAWGVGTDTVYSAREEMRAKAIKTESRANLCLWEQEESRWRWTMCRR